TFGQARVGIEGGVREVMDFDDPAHGKPPVKMDWGIFEIRVRILAIRAALWYNRGSSKPQGGMTHDGQPHSVHRSG
ncbi:MAG: hypothetical protein IKZ41_08665, partial [Clostridia bacterium]|nr:hypothetical protein [Clostridia bacterium]